MAVAAVDVQVSTAPLVDFGSRVAGIDKPRQTFRRFRGLARTGGRRSIPRFFQKSDMPERSNLIVCHAAEIVLTIDLWNLERQCIFGPGIVAAQAFRPRGIAPGLLPSAFGSGRVGDHD